MRGLPPLRYLTSKPVLRQCHSEAVWLKAILNDMALFGGPDVLRCDAQGLADRLPDQCQRLNATYAHMTPARPARADLTLGAGCGERLPTAPRTPAGAGLPTKKPGTQAAGGEPHHKES